MEAVMSLISPELRACVGLTARYTAPDALGAASFRYFALAIGDENPVYTSPDAARAAGYEHVIAPPTFVCETNQYMTRSRDEDGYAGHSWDLPVPLGARLIRGGHQYELFRPVGPDDVITALWRIDDIYEKPSSKGGGMVFVISTATYSNQRDEKLATNTETNIFQIPFSAGTPS